MNIYRGNFGWLHNGILLLLICVFFSTFSAAQNTAQTPRKGVYSNSQSVPKICKVYGKTLDLQDAVISRVLLKFQSNGTVQEVTSDDLGNYSVNLPVGIYDVINYKQSGLARYKRANLSVTCQREEDINIYFLPVCLSYGCENPKEYYSSFSPRLSANKKLNVVVNFLGKKKIKPDLVYTTAVLTYNNLTVYADKLTQGNNSRTITAEGNVWLENGEKRTSYDKVSLNFDKATVEIIGKEVASIQR